MNPPQIADVAIIGLYICIAENNNRVRIDERTQDAPLEKIAKNLGLIN